MDQLLPNSEFPFIPSIGTPLHQPEENLILPSAEQAQYAFGNSSNNSQVTSGFGGRMESAGFLGGSGGLSSYSFELSPVSLPQSLTTSTNRTDDMGQMLLSPGFPSIPSFRTPLHQPERNVILPSSAEKVKWGWGKSSSNSPTKATTSGIQNMEWDDRSSRESVCSSSFSSRSSSFLIPQSRTAPPTPQNLLRAESPASVHSFPQSNGIPTGMMSMAAGPSSVDVGITPQIQNIISTINMGCKLDLKVIALTARNAEYNPKRFAAVIMRIREPRTTALLFATGKMICTGAKNEDDSRLAARKFARIVQKLGFQAKFQDFKIQNVVGSCDVKFHVRLEGIECFHKHFVSYEPELFPGLIYRMLKPRVVMLIFISGKIIFTGAKTRQEIYEAFDYIYPIVKSFQKPPKTDKKLP